MKDLTCCSSMVIRDLTLRSAASFGSFHLIRLLYDEFMFYLVEHKVANATGETPIAVMGEVRQVRVDPLRPLAGWIAPQLMMVSWSPENLQQLLWMLNSVFPSREIRAGKGSPFKSLQFSTI